MFSDHDYGDDDEKCEHCSPSDSISSEISMDESFLKRLFKACDRDNDGFLDRGDLEEVCKQLVIEENVSQIIEQLGGGNTGKISYDDFCRNKSILVSGMNTGHTSSSESNSAPEFWTDTEYSTKNKQFGGEFPKRKEKDSRMDRIGRASASQNPRMSAKGSSAPAPSNVDLTEYLDPSTLQQLQNLQVISPNQSAAREQPKGTDFLEIANRLHLAALTQLKNEIFESNTRLSHVTTERDDLMGKLQQLSSEKQRMQKEYEERLQSQMMRVTELQSVIAELTRKLKETTGNKIIEEDEDVEESQCSSDLDAEGGSNACSECSCGEAECSHNAIEEGPNQVNFLASTNDVTEEDVASRDEVDDFIQEKAEHEDQDQYDVLKRVIGNLELMTERKKSNTDGIIEKELAIETSATPNTIQDLQLMKNRHDAEEKLPIQKDAQQTAAEDYLPRRTAESQSQEEINTLNREREKLKNRLKKTELELEEVKAANITVREDRERMRKKIRTLQDALERNTNTSHSPILSPSPTPSGGSNRTNSLPRQSHMNSHQNSEARRMSSQANVHSSSSSSFTPIPTKKFSGSPASSLQRHKAVMGASSDLGSSVGDDTMATQFAETLARCLRSKVPETLLQTLVTYSRFDQIIESLHAHYSSEIIEKTRELELQAEHLTSKLSHLKSQNDLLQLCLEESKGNCERLSLLVAKYESKDTALTMALQNTDQIIEAYEVMLQLQESEQDLLVASYRSNVQTFTTDTMKSLTSTNSSKSNVSGASSLTSNSHYQLTYGDDIAEDEEGITMFRNSQTKRRDAESHAKNLLSKLDRKYEVTLTGCIPFEDMDSRTSTLSSVDSSNIETLSKEEEMRLKEYVQLLKSERSTVQTTVVELESVTDVLEHFDDSNIEPGDKGSLDLETAVLLQELQALKEERAELKHRIFMLEKEKKALELKLSSREAQEQGYIAHIEYLKSEVREQIKKQKQIAKGEKKLRATTMDDDGRSSTSGSVTIGLAGTDSRASEDDIPQDLIEAARREKKLKTRIQELVDTLEKLSKNSEIRHQQTAEYIADLKRANGALVSAYEKAKKRHASRLKKFEAQLITMAEKHQQQTKILKERIAQLSSENEKQPPRKAKESTF